MMDGDDGSKSRRDDGLESGSLWALEGSLLVTGFHVAGELRGLCFKPLIMIDTEVLSEPAGKTNLGNSWEPPSAAQPPQAPLVCACCRVAGRLISNRLLLPT